MPQFLSTTEPDFDAAFGAILSMKREDSPDVDAAVAAIIADVRARGDAAVIELSERFDRVRLTPKTLRFSAAEIDALCARVTLEDAAALELAAVGSGPTTNGRFRRMHPGWMPAARLWAGGGRPSRRRGYMCRGDWRPIRRLC